MEFYVTYPQRLEHRNCYSIVKADDELAARRQIVAARGIAWAFIYPTAEAAGVVQFDLSEVPLVTDV